MKILECLYDDSPTGHPSEAQNFGASGEWVREGHGKEFCGSVGSSGEMRWTAT